MIKSKIKQLIVPIFKEYSSSYSFVTKITHLLLLTVPIISIFMVAHIFTLNRSLWLDEAFLAYSIANRSLRTLTSSPLDWMQSAPVFYLYIVKIITQIFGLSEATLRAFSFITFIGTLPLVYLVLRKVFKTSVTYALVGVALLSTLHIYLRYAHELKPYMSDGFFVLLSIYAYYTFSKSVTKISFIKLTALFSVLIWFSNPVIFFIAGIYIYEFISALRKKEYLHLKRVIISGAVALISFVLYYFYWLNPVIDHGGMQNFWSGHRFPLIPTSMEDLRLIPILFGGLIQHFGSFPHIFSILILVGLIASTSKKSKYTYVMLISIGLLLIASSLERYPIADRLMLFIYPIFIIYVSIALYEINVSDKKVYNHVAKVIIVIILLLSNNTYFTYFREPFVRGQEANELIEFVHENIEEDETLYVHFHSITVFGFRNDYNDFIGVNNTQNIPNVIFGTTRYWGGDEDMLNEEVRKIVDNQPTYVLFSHMHMVSYRINPLRDRLREVGTLELVMSVHGTPLYYFQTHHMPFTVEYDFNAWDRIIRFESNTDNSIYALNDGNPNTRWTTGRPQQVGDYMLFEFSEAVNFNYIKLDYGAAGSDYPRSLSVYTSLDGDTWKNAPVEDFQNMHFVFSSDSYRFIKLVTTGYDDIFWWSVFDMNFGYAE